MELKWDRRAANTKCIRVSIVPLWNWNLGCLIAGTYRCMFQSYLYGIEIIINRCLRGCILVSIVPLWNWNICCATKWLYSICRFNRTFMELKFVQILTLISMLMVSIVPLWNWNNPEYRCIRENEAFQSYLYGIEIWIIALLPILARVSIVPLWNWNRLFINFKRRGVMFQSYLYGIEMRD